MGGALEPGAWNIYIYIYGRTVVSVPGVLLNMMGCNGILESTCCSFLNLIVWRIVRLQLARKPSESKKIRKTQKVQEQHSKHWGKPEKLSEIYGSLPKTPKASRKPQKTIKPKNSQQNNKKTIENNPQKPQNQRSEQAWASLSPYLLRSCPGLLRSLVFFGYFQWFFDYFD